MKAEHDLRIAELVKMYIAEGWGWQRLAHGGKLFVPPIGQPCPIVPVVLWRGAWVPIQILTKC